MRYIPSFFFQTVTEGCFLKLRITKFDFKKDNCFPNHLALHLCLGSAEIHGSDSEADSYRYQTSLGSPPTYNSSSPTPNLCLNPSLPVNNEQAAMSGSFVVPLSSVDSCRMLFQQRHQQQPSTEYSSRKVSVSGATPRLSSRPQLLPYRELRDLTAVMGGGSPEATDNPIASRSTAGSSGYESGMSKPCEAPCGKLTKPCSLCSAPEMQLSVAKPRLLKHQSHAFLPRSTHNEILPKMSKLQTKTINTVAYT